MAQMASFAAGARPFITKASLIRNWRRRGTLRRILMTAMSGLSKPPPGSVTGSAEELSANNLPYSGIYAAQDRKLFLSHAGKKAPVR